MKRLNFLSVLFVALFLTTTIFAQFTRQQAIDLILNDVLSDDMDNIDVYASFNSFSDDAALIDNDNATNPYAGSWVFYVNDSPFAAWYHQCRYIFVNASNGDYSTVGKEIYPKFLLTDYEEISSAVRPDLIAMDGTPFVPDPQKVESNYNYALIICAMDNMRNISNVSLIFNVLIQNYNYKKENIIVLYNYDGHNYSNRWYDDLDGPLEPSYDIDGEATWENIQTTITNLSTDLEHSDQLAIFFTGVPVQIAGATVNMGFPVDANIIELYPAYDLSQAIDNINCGQMILNFDVNSASEVSSLFEATGSSGDICKNRYLTGSTSTYENNYAEMYFSGGNYSEQLFYWASAARGFLPDVNAP